MTKDELERLNRTVEAFCSYIESLPPEALTEQEWGPKEVLAHLVFHHQGYVAMAEAIAQGKPLIPPKGRFRDINAYAVDKSRGVDTAELVEQFRQVNHRLVALYQSSDPEAVSFRIKQDSKLFSLTELVPAAEAHIRNHQRKLEREQLKRGY